MTELGRIHILRNPLRGRGLSQILIFDNMGGGDDEKNTDFFLLKARYVLCFQTIFNL